MVGPGVAWILSESKSHNYNLMSLSRSHQYSLMNLLQEDVLSLLNNHISSPGALNPCLGLSKTSALVSLREKPAWNKKPVAEYLYT